MCIHRAWSLRSARPPSAPARASSACLVGLLLALLAASAASAAPLCPEVSPLSLLGLDTAAGRALFTLAAPAGRVLVELDADSDEARLHPLPQGPPRFAGSNGPGPVLALAACGDACVRVQRWEASGTWRPLGPPLDLSPRLILYTTYDGRGRPWVVAHATTDEPAWVEARAFRLALDGERWLDRGRLPVTGVTPPGAAPAPWRTDAVVTGTGLFTAGEEPARWVSGLPALPPGKRGQVVPLDATAAAYLAADGGVYSSSDGGRTWRGSRWRPWGVERSAIWTFGADYGLDTPLGALGSPLPVIWSDRREREDPRLVLTTLSGDGSWQPRAELPLEVLADTGDRLEIIHFLRTAGGTWVLLSDCFAAGSTSGLARRTYTPAGLSPPRFVPIR